MQELNWLMFQPLLPVVDTLDTRLRDALLFAIQAFCAAGSRKVASRAEMFQFVPREIGSRYYRHNLSTMTCMEAGNRWENVR